MTKVLKPTDVAQRLLSGESAESIFCGSAGSYKAKLLGPEASVRASSEQSRAIDFVISTEAVDRYTDTVKLGGWRTQNYVRNPVVLWAHDDSIPAIARGTNVRVDGRSLRSTAVFAERDDHPLADTIYRLVLGKFINAASVGFVPLQAKAANSKDRPFGLDITEQELLEWSCCNIPANPECLAEARSVGVDTSPLIEWTERILDGGGMMIVPRAQLELLRKAAGAADQLTIFSRTDGNDWKVGASRDLPIDDKDSWDGPAAAKRMLDAAGFDGDNPDSAKARRGFLVYDAANPTLRGSYKLPFADIVGGELKAIAGGIRAAASRLPQTDIPQSVQDNARAVLDHYESKMNSDGKGKAMKISRKGLYEVSWLAQLLCELCCLEDWVEYEAEMEGDGSDIPQRLTDALKALGQILIDMTQEEVAELLSEEDGADAPLMADEPMAMSLSKAQKAVLALVRMARVSAAASVGVTVRKFEAKDIARLFNAPTANIAPVETRAGKVLSAANKQTLSDAHDHMMQAGEMVKGVIDMADMPDEPDDDEAKAMRERRARARKAKVKLIAVS